MAQALAFAWAERAAGHLALELGECVSASPDVPSLHRRAGALAPLLQARCRPYAPRARRGSCFPQCSCLCAASCCIVWGQKGVSQPCSRGGRRLWHSRAGAAAWQAGCPALLIHGLQRALRQQGCSCADTCAALCAQALAALQPGVMLPLSEGYCLAANTRLTRELRAAATEMRRSAAARLAAAPPEPDIIKGARRVRRPAQPERRHVSTCTLFCYDLFLAHWA